jgi:N-methylhydantoinase B
MDPVTLSVVRSSLEQICDEMDIHTIRSAMSPIISETNDCAHGIYHPTTGETIAQGHLGLPIFLTIMQFIVQNTIAEADRQGGFAPGDVWILNDVYLGGTHLNDVSLVMPLYIEGELFAILANTGHWMDVGASVPGGWIPDARDIHQEGLRIPPARLYQDGRLDQGLLDTFLANVRLPRDIASDTTALSSALRLGEQRLLALVDRYGVELLKECQAEMIERSERQMRSHIEEIPDGTYRFADFVDNDGVTDEPLEIRVEVVVRGSSMTIDLTGTAPATAGPVNISRNTTVSTCYVVLKHIFPDVPVNGGTFRPIEVIVPPGSVTDAEYPRPTSGYMETVGRVLDALFGALAQAIPELVPAASFGTTGVVTVAGWHPERHRFIVGTFPYPGGYGATLETDGLVHGNTPQSMANFVSLEASEHRYPVRFDYFKLREGSGGAGWHRGGDGTSYRFTATSELVVSILGDRADRAPFGIEHGGDAAANEIVLTTGGGEWTPPMRTKLTNEPLAPGDAVAASSPGGGGYGDPLARDVELVERDLNYGYIGPEEAEEVYGVVIAERVEVAGRPRFRLDVEGSRELRQRLGAEPAPAAAPAEREAPPLQRV